MVDWQQRSGVFQFEHLAMAVCEDVLVPEFRFLKVSPTCMPMVSRLYPGSFNWSRLRHVSWYHVAR
jgi:hypothetical protein